MIFGCIIKFLCFNLGFAEGGRSPADPPCRLVFESEGETPPSRLGRRRSLVSSEPQHVTLIVFGVGMVNRTHLEADIGGLTMEAELKKIHGSFTLKEKMKGNLGGVYTPQTSCRVTKNILTMFSCRYPPSEDDGDMRLGSHWLCEHCASGRSHTRHTVSISCNI